ncbi:MAG: MGH1-like glycoside hydrolase domain-containing protein [Saccharofermentanales bacterium]
MEKFCLAEIFTDHMVVQRNAPVCLYGSASDGCVVSASIISDDGHVNVKAQTQTQTQTLNRQWRIFMPEIPAGGPYDITVDCSTGEKITISDVLCGDVWIAGGQSNMELVLCAVEISEEVKNHPDIGDGKIRLYTVPHRAFETVETKNEKLESCISMTSRWVDCKGADALNFSAIAYYFARKLSEKVDVPIGLISCSWGATSIVNWMPEDMLRQIPKFDKLLDEYNEIVESMDMDDYNARFIDHLKDIDDYIALYTKLGYAPPEVPYPAPPYGPKSYVRPAGLYHTMLSKIIMFRTMGMLWYQGESDAIADRCDEYKEALTMFFQMLKNESDNRDLYFLSVQLAPFGDGWIPGDFWMRICQSQLELTMEDPNYAMVTIGDCGDKNIHPPRKVEVGERLALAAMNKCFGMDVEYSGPLLKNAYRIDDSIVIEFSHAEDGLVVSENGIGLFEIAGNDGVYKAADAKIAGNQVMIRSGEIGFPVSARYAWDVFYEIGLFNKSMLPASLFTFSLVDGRFSLDRKPPRVTLYTTDIFMKKLYDVAEKKIKKNVVVFDGMETLIEGSEWYRNLWIETQPMGGEMYAKRDLDIGLNNQLIFMKYQRMDGRLPSMLSLAPNIGTQVYFGFLQGYCFPMPAYKMYFLTGDNDKEYLKKLYIALEGHDNYLWKYRDSNGDGCLETWCVWDTGEDESTRLKGAPNSWGGETPPSGYGKMPYQSMDIMSYSYGGRNVLALISKELDNGKEDYWRKKAEEVREKIKDYLWISEKNACYDRDCNGEFMDVLIHNNLRVMYHDAFTQEMADAFIKYHMLNPAEFWTEMPLPSIAVNDPLFYNNIYNDWSGQPQGLTYQRTIRALENYGHYAEITLLGKKLIQAAGKKCIFTQQFDPFTGEISSPDQDCYGPTILAVLEYISRLYGIHIDEKEVFWSGINDDGHPIKYSQEWQGDVYSLSSENGQIKGFINDEEKFCSSDGTRVVTDLSGNVTKIIGIDIVPRKVSLETTGKKYEFDIKPNEVFMIDGENKPCLLQKAPFDYPYNAEK